MPAISADVFCLVGYLYQAKADAIGYEWTKELVVVTGDEYHSGATLGMAQDPTHHIGVALFPTPLVALYLPSIDDVSYQIQGITGVVFEEIVQGLGLAVSGAKMHI